MTSGTNVTDDAERAPLLGSDQLAKQREHDKIYERFSRRQKWAIVALVSWAGLLPLFVSGSFVPSIPDIAREMHSSGEIINLAVSLSILAMALGGLLWASYSSVYGRRPIYLASLPLLALGSLGVTLAPTVPTLLTTRFVQAFGASAGMSVGSGVVGDIYRLEERGGAMGVFFAAVLLGAAVAPLAGGLAAAYGSWRHMQLALALAGLVSFALILLFFPETSHDALKVHPVGGARGGAGGARGWVNPVRSLGLMRSPNLLCVCLAGTVVLLTDYVLLIPIAYTIGKRYNITNEALIGACFLPAGLGNIIGAPTAGLISDRIVHAYRTKRGGVWVPEDRLRAALPGALVLVPLSVLWCGVCTQWVPGVWGLAGNLVGFFVNGFGVDLVLSPSAAYGVDVVHSRSAEVMAANSALRSLVTALGTALVLPALTRVGVAATDALAAGLAWVGFGLLYATIRYGDRMRAWVDVGYSTAETN